MKKNMRLNHQKKRRKYTDVKFMPTEGDKEFIRQLQKDIDIVDQTIPKTCTEV